MFNVMLKLGNDDSSSMLVLMELRDFFKSSRDFNICLQTQYLLGHRGHLTPVPGILTFYFPFSAVLEYQSQ